MTPSRFVAHLAEMRLPAVFNPYVDVCSVHDRSNAARLRKRNLLQFLEAALEAKVNTIWVARDLGYRGGRRTGVPLTDDVHLESAGRMLGGVELQRATKGPVVAERTAAVVWRVLSDIKEPVVLWNVFPFHPHEPDDPFSNRCHTASERQLTLPLLSMLIEMFRPRQLVAIGRDAEGALQDFSVPVAAVRHPSYGGQSEFIATLYTMYGVKSTRSQPELAL